MAADDEQLAGLPGGDTEGAAEVEAGELLVDLESGDPDYRFRVLRGIADRHGLWEIAQTNEIPVDDAGAAARWLESVGLIAYVPESWGYVVTDLGAQRLRTWARLINARRAPARPVRAVA